MPDELGEKGGGLDQMNKRFVAALPSLVLTFALSACGGGGGVNSTPTPPTPTPTPPPTSANADMITLTQSEDFTNDAVTGSATYSKEGSRTAASSAPSALSVIYDAASRTYTVSTGERSQSFAQAHMDSSLGNAQITVFKRVSGATTDTFTLTNAASSGDLTYRYVGGGFWQRTIDSTTSVNGAFDAFTYGVETPDAALPRTGGASYAVDLLGVVASPDALYSMSGDGTLTANLLTGSVRAGALTGCN